MGSGPLTLRTARGIVEYAEAGQGPAVLALHGAMGGWDQSLLLARAAVDLSRFRAVALSRPGYLGTALAAGRSPEEQAALYGETLDALGVTRAAVIAISGGGRSAIELALRHPERVWALVLISTVGEPMGGRLPLSFHVKMWLGRRAWFAERIRKRIERDPERAAARAIRDPSVRARTFADPEAGPLLREQLAGAAAGLSRRIDGTRNDILVGRGPAPRFGELRTPTLVVHGTEDPVVPYARHGAVLARGIPGAEHLAVEGGEHFAIFSHRAAIRERVTAFLHTHAPG